MNIHSGTPVKVIVNNYEYISNIIPETAKERALTTDTIIAQFQKTGNTPFYINNFEIHLDENLFLPISAINVLRRESLEAYEKFFISKIERCISPTPLAKLESRMLNNSPKEVSVFLQFLKDLLDLHQLL